MAWSAEHGVFTDPEGTIPARGGDPVACWKPLNREDLPAALHGPNPARMSREQFERYHGGVFPHPEEYADAKHRGDPRFDTHYWHPQHGWAHQAPDARAEDTEHE